MIYHSRTAFLLLAGLLLILGACNVTKTFREGEYLLVRNTLKTDNRKISNDELSGYLQQTPNKKFLGIFHPGIAFYNWGSKGKDSKLKKWLRTKVGAAPVILDSTLISVSRKQMGLYLNNIGYFHSRITDTVEYRKKKAKVTYRVSTTKPYVVSSLNWSIRDTQLARFVYLDSGKCLIVREKNFNTYTLDDERTRIATALVNQGYYHFSTNYIVFTIDSSFNNRQMEVTIEILNPVVPSLQDFGMVIESRHRRYKIHNLYIFPQFDNQQRDTATYDTITRTYPTPHGGQDSLTYYFLYNRKARLREKTITQNILIEPGSWFNLTDIDQTYNRLSGLQTFKYIHIDFDNALPAPGERLTPPDQLDTRIRLAQASTHSLTWSADGTNSSGALGVDGNIGYQNRNLFRGAQLFRITLSGSLQMQAGGGGGGLFNTVELGANASLTFPQFLIPIRQERLPKSFKPRTTLSVGYNFQQKQDPDYYRHITNISFGYTWIQSAKLSHTLNPIQLLMVKVYPSPEFTAKLDSLEDQRFKNQYTDHMIPGLKYTLTFSNQDVSRHRNFLYIRTNFQTSGNLLYGIDNLVKAPKNADGKFTLFKIQYSQFVRPDLDFRFYNQYGKGFSVVYRFFGGIGIPYGNSTVLPFEMAFLAGGANDMRGWRMGDLGPGTFHNDTVSQNYGQLGDIQLQFQVEYRFPMYSFLKGALFVDIGNVWLLEDSPDLPGGKFEFDTFVSEMGIDVGFGFRLDFDFFIFRLDPAIPIRVPSSPGDHWYFNKLQLRDIIWNFGIGYPF